MEKPQERRARLLAEAQASLDQSVALRESAQEHFRRAKQLAKRSAWRFRLVWLAYGVVIGYLIGKGVS